MAPKYILFYFDLAGRGEGIRYLLHYKKIEFEDRRISFEQWPAHKSQMPAGQVPVLEIVDGKSGKKLAQSAAICRYLGNEHGLMASGAWDNAKLDEAADSASEILMSEVVPRLMGEKDEGKKETIRAEIAEKLLPKLDTWVRMTQLSDSHHFIGGGSKPTWADFYVGGLLTFVNTVVYKGSIASSNKALGDYLNRIRHLDGVKDYVAQHP